MSKANTTKTAADSSQSTIVTLYDQQSGKAVQAVKGDKWHQRYLRRGFKTTKPESKPTEDE